MSESGLPARRAPVVRVVDLFCGAGGLAYGLKSAGFEIAVGVDLDPACRHPFETNCGGVFIEKSVADLAKAELDGWFEGCGYPRACRLRPVSRSQLLPESQDARWAMGASSVVPETCGRSSTRNRYHGECTWPFSQTDLVGIRGGPKDAGYYVTWEEVLCSDFGVPQSRKRLVLIASQIGPVEMPTAQIGRRGGLCEMLSLTYPRWGQARHMPMMRCTSLAVSVRPISNVSGPRNQAAVGGIGLRGALERFPAGLNRSAFPTH